MTRLALPSEPALVYKLPTTKLIGLLAPTAREVGPPPREYDLTSDTAWTMRCDDAPVQAVKVPASEQNSDQQSPQNPSAAVKDHVVYKRQIAIPSEAQDKTMIIQFGGCNYGAEVWLEDKRAADHTGPVTPFEADLNGVAKPGVIDRLRVKTYTRMHYGKPRTVEMPATRKFTTIWIRPISTDKIQK